MIRHVALFKFNDDASAEQIGDLMAALLRLKDDVPAIEHIDWGENFSTRSNGYSHIVSMRFANRDTLTDFYDHPVHKRVAATMIKPITADLLLIDYEEQSL